MNLPAYCSSSISAAYFQLLRFARISDSSRSADTTDEARTTLYTINSLPTIEAHVQPLLPLLYHNAVKSGLFERLHTDAQNFLKQNALILVAAEMLNQQWLKTTFELFKKHDLAIILLKGAAFANSLYPPDAPRTGVDLDILVKKNDFDKACNLLAESMKPVLLAENRAATHDALFERMFISQDRVSEMYPKFRTGLLGVISCQLRRLSQAG